MVVTFCVMKNPLIILQFFDYFSALHIVCVIHTEFDAVNEFRGHPT